MLGDYYLKGRDDEMIKGIETIIKTFAYMIGGSAIEVERDVPDVVNFEIALAKSQVGPSKKYVYSLA
jgi:hypothetical protein